MQTTIAGALASLFAGKSTHQDRLATIDRTVAEIEADERSAAEALKVAGADLNEAAAAAAMERKPMDLDMSLIERGKKRLEVLALAKAGLLKERAKVEVEASAAEITRLQADGKAKIDYVQSAIVVSYTDIAARYRLLSRLGVDVQAEINALPAFVRPYATAKPDPATPLTAICRNLALLGADPQKLLPGVRHVHNPDSVNPPVDAAAQIAAKVATVESKFAKTLGYDAGASHAAAVKAEADAEAAAEAKEMARAQAKAAYIEALKTYAANPPVINSRDGFFAAHTAAHDLHVLQLDTPRSKINDAIAAWESEMRSKGGEIGWQINRRALASVLGLPLPTFQMP